MSPLVAIRPVIADDFDRLLEINNAAVPAVNALTRVELEHFAAIAPYFRVAHPGDGAAAGMMIALAPASDYGSANYRWFEAHYHGFLYVDRIVVDPAARSAGIGAALYSDLEAAARAMGAPRLACEVNLRPANTGSLAFHERLGFRPVGTQDTEGGAKTVQLMVLELA